MKKFYLILPILSGILFGSSGIFVRTLTENGIDASTLLFLRFSIAIPVIFTVILVTDRNLLKIRLKDFKLFVVTALSIVGLNIFYNTSMNTVPLSLAAVLLSSAPVFVIIFAYLLFGEKITFKKVLSIILVITGCFLTTGFLEGNALNIAPFGILCGIIAAVFWAIYTVASKKGLEDGFHTYTILFYSIILISLVLLPFTHFNQMISYVNSNPQFNIIFLILHSALSFAMPYILITLALKYMESGIASIFTSGSEPLAALLFGIVIYSEVPSILMLTGILITISALTIISKSSQS